MLAKLRTWWPIVVALLYGASPIDAVPDVVPIYGLVDDLGVGGLALLLAIALWRRHRAAAADEESTTDVV